VKLSRKEKQCSILFEDGKVACERDDTILNIFISWNVKNKEKPLEYK
jgi:hypothetical protein